MFDWNSKNIKKLRKGNQCKQSKINEDFEEAKAATNYGGKTRIKKRRPKQTLEKFNNKKGCVPRSYGLIFPCARVLLPRTDHFLQENLGRTGKILHPEHCSSWVRNIGITKIIKINS